MKILVVAGTLWALAVPGVWADLTVVQKVEGPGQEVENTFRFKEGKLRLDASPGTSIIEDLKSKDLVNLMHGPKTFLKIPAVLQQLAAPGATPAPDAVEAKPVFVPTGKKDVVSGFAAEEYTGTVTGIKIILWLTRDLPGYEKALGEMNDAFKIGLVAPLLDHFLFDLTRLPGFPVRTVIEEQPGRMVSRTVVSVSTGPVPDSAFEIPGDYKLMTLPLLTPPAAEKPVATP